MRVGGGGRPGVDPWQWANNPWPTPVTSQQVFGQSDRTSANGVTFGMPPGFRAHRWRGSHGFHNGATDALSRLLFQEQRHRFLQPLAHHHREWALWKFKKIQWIQTGFPCAVARMENLDLKSQRTGWFQELVGEGGGRGGTLFLSKI